MLSAFREGLGEAGYSEGRNIAIEYRWAETHADLSGLPRHRKVDVIMTGRAFGDRREAGDLPLLRAALRRPSRAGGSLVTGRGIAARGPPRRTDPREALESAYRLKAMAKE